MKNYNKDEESSYIQYLDANNLYGRAMSKKLPVNGFRWLDSDEINEINGEFIKNYNENDKKGYILEVDVKYPKELHDLHSDLPFLPKRMEINKCKKLVCNLYNKKKYVVHINSLKQALNHGLKLKEIHRIIAHNICNLRYKVPKEIPVAFHNGPTYDYHFIIKELVKEFNGNFDCLGVNTEKYIAFSVPLKKKIENKDIKINYKMKFIDSCRFMSSSLSKLVDNLSEGIHNNKCFDCKSNLDYVRITKNKKITSEWF